MISGFAQLLGDALVVLLRHVLTEMNRRLAPPVFQLLKNVNVCIKAINERFLFKLCNRKMKNI